MKRTLLINIFISFLIFDAQNLSRESYINIPTANFNEGIFINLNGNYPFNSISEVKFDPNLGVELYYSKFNANLKWYNGSDFAIDFAYRLLEGDSNIPKLCIGVNDITYNKFISSAGSDKTFDDEEYIPRPPEVASVYLVATKVFNEYIELTAGVGRGRFVGYGPRSHLLNFDVLFGDKHENVVFGLFGGAKFSMPGGTFIIAETDGRNANLGIQYESGLFKGTLALTKIEHFGKSKELSLTPRINATLSFKLNTLEGLNKTNVAGKGNLKLILIDSETGEFLNGTLILRNSQGKIAEMPVSGKESITLNSGMYMLTMNSPNHIGKSFKVSVDANKTKDIFIDLIKDENVKKEEVKTEKLDKEELRKRIESYRIHFDFNDFGIPAPYYKVLDKLIEILKSYSKVRIEIGGHASSEGTLSHNQWLSETRAKAVREYLISQGINPRRLFVRGYGETKPISLNITKAGRIKNRRVKFIIISYD